MAVRTCERDSVAADDRHTTKVEVAASAHAEGSSSEAQSGLRLAPFGFRLLRIGGSSAAVTANDSIRGYVYAVDATGIVFLQVTAQTGDSIASRRLNRGGTPAPVSLMAGATGYSGRAVRTAAEEMALAGFVDWSLTGVLRAEEVVVVTGSLYLLADLASVRPSCLPWQASASG